MEVYLVYFLEVLSLQTILFVLYWLIARNGSHFQFNRYFLLSALILPFFIPFINVPFQLFEQEKVVEGIFDPWILIEQSLPSVTISGAIEDSNSISWWITLVIGIYSLITIYSLLRLFKEFGRIANLSKLSIKKEISPKGYNLHYVSSKILSFSFINKIFLSDSFSMNEEEKKTIVTHEEYHLSQRHSIDVILAEIIRVVCWFNPITYLIQNNLKELHEYLADQYTVKLYGKNDYTRILRSFKREEINMALGSAFADSHIKKRVGRIHQTSQKRNKSNMLLLSIVSILAIFIFACENELDSLDKNSSEFTYTFSDEDLENEISKKVAGLSNAPQDLLDNYVSSQYAQPDFLFMPEMHWISEVSAQEMTPEKIKGANSKMGHLDLEIEYFRILSSEETMRLFHKNDRKLLQIVSGYVIIKKVNRYQYFEHRSKMNVKDNHIYDDYDKMATFEGGMEGLSLFLRENLKYPEMAEEKGIEDQLVMRFVVTKHGGLLYLNIDKEPATEDEDVNLAFQIEAFKALSATEGKWKPAEKNGKYVMSRMTLPIEFKLEEKVN